MAIEVKIDAFEGPLDLLLHLIDKNKIDIYDIPIASITDQYMEYLHEMERLDMNGLSEFLVMAATLLDIKARMLLPQEEDENGEEIDPREELVQKLLEYKMYKYMSYELKDLEEAAVKAFYGRNNMPAEVTAYEAPIDYEELIGDTTLTRLNEIFQFVLQRREDKIDPVRSTFGKIEKEDIDMDARQASMKNYLRGHRKCSFRELLEKADSKMEVIVTFMLLLEMMKLGSVQVQQDELFSEIYITVDADKLNAQPDTTEQLIMSAS